MNARTALLMALATMVLAGCAQGLSRGDSAREATSAQAHERARPALDIERARLAALFDRLDLERPGLEAVKAHHAAGDLDSAGRALIAYYRAGANAAWIRDDYTLHAPDSGADAQSRAREALADTFTFQGVTGTAPRLANGRLDWDHRGPRDDREWALFFNRHFLLLPLVHQHKVTRDPTLARYAGATLRDWVLSRTPEDKPVERDISPAWQPMSSASRLLQAWPHTFFGFIDAADFTDETRLLMLSSVPEQAAHLMKHHRKRHNHTIKEMTGLAHAAAVWPEFKDADVWRAYAIDTLKGELDRQFYADGVHQELSAHYHRSALQYYVWLKDFEGASGRTLPAAFAQSVERAADYLAQSMSPQGFGPLNNNGDLDDNRARILDFADRFNRSDWRFIASNGADGTPPHGLSRFYPWAGQAFLRNGFDQNAQFALFDVGPWGAAHQHNDKLNVTISAFGRQLLVDGGRYRYESTDPYVQYFRASRGHNVLLLDGKGQGPDAPITDKPQAGAFASGPEVDVVRGAFTAGFEGLEGMGMHQRALIYVRDGYWLVVDRIETDRPRTVSALFRHAPDVSVKTEGGQTYSDDPDKGNLRIIPIGRTRFDLEVVRGREAPEPMGWHSPDYNDRRAASVAIFRGRIKGVTTFAWLLQPSKGVAPAARVRLISESPDRIAVRVTRPGLPADTIDVRFAGADATRPAFRLQRAGQQPIVFSQTIE